MMNLGQLLSVFLTSVIIGVTSEVLFEYTNQFEVEHKEDGMQINTAELVITTDIDRSIGKSCDINVLQLSDNCYNCSWFSIGQYNTKHHKNMSFIVDAQWPLKVQVIASRNNHTCNMAFHQKFEERGIYQTTFTMNTTNQTVSCFFDPITELKHPVNSNIPLAVLFAILVAASIVYYTGLKLKEKYTQHQLDSANEETAQPLVDAVNDASSSAEVKPKSERIKSIDAFRGLSIIVMVFVNYRGGKYWFFHHSAWNGLTVADLVFPWFMFIMGISMVISMESLINKQVSTGQILYKIIRRTLILLGLGLLISNANKTWTTMRIPGVLQRFSISYLITALMQYGFHVSGHYISNEKMEERNCHKFLYYVKDIVFYWKQWIVMVALEIIWLCLTFLLPVPGCPTGYIGPAGLAVDKQYENCTGGAAGYIDQVIFGKNHMYGHPTCKNVYFPMFSKNDQVHFDPEGLLGSINSCFIVFLGLQAGKIFLYYKSPKSRIIRFIVWAMLLGVISAILTKCTQNEGWIPVNKNLWSLSFVTTLSCMAFIIMSFMYYLIDVWKVWSGVPLHFVGMNSILVYVGHEIFSIYILFNWGLTNYSTHAQWLAMSALGAFDWVVISYYCYRVKFFLKI